MTSRASTAAAALVMTGALVTWCATLGPPLRPEPGVGELHVAHLRLNPLAAFTLPWAFGLYVGGLAGLWVLRVRNALSFRAVVALLCGVLGFLVGIKLQFRLETMPFTEAITISPRVLTEPGARMPLGLWFGVLTILAVAALLRAGWREVGDASAVVFSVTIPFGRVACMLAGCCFGTVCSTWLSPLCVTYARGTAPFAHQVTSGQINPVAEATLPLHPLPLYFAAASIVTLAILVWQLRRGAEPGTLLATFAILRPAAKLALEPLRAEGRPGPLMVLAPATAIVIATTALVIRHLRWRHRAGRAAAALGRGADVAPDVIGSAGLGPVNA